MSFLAAHLPSPKRSSSRSSKSVNQNNHHHQKDHQSTITTEIIDSSEITCRVPPYGERILKRFVPKRLEDFDDGGAFPEIHVLQYPLDMGRKGKTYRREQSTQLALTLDQDGNVDTDNVVRHGQRKDKIIYSKYTDLIEATTADTNALEKPSEDEQERVAMETKNKLEKLINRNIKAAYKGSKHRASEEEHRESKVAFLRYTPVQANNADSFANGSETRLVKIEEAPVDPLEPAKFKSKRLVVREGSPPVPVMHSPPKKLTREEKEDWNIPSCISNWKNPKGFTIPLDKRLAADGRGLQEVQINDNFAKLSSALYSAESKAREDISQRAKYEKLRLLKEEEEKERKMQDLAAKRSLGIALSDEDDSDSSDSDSDSSESESESDADEELRRRNQIRKKLETEREYRKSASAYKSRGGKKYGREEDRDVSEKVALNQTAKDNQESFGGDMDSRLYNQEGGLNSGFGDDDSYNVYEKPLFKSEAAHNIYKPTRTSTNAYDDSLEELAARSTKKFKGKDGEEVGSRLDGPVQFERARTSSSKSKPSSSDDKPNEKEAKTSSSSSSDPFGLGKYITQIKKGSDRKGLDHIGKKGFLNASASSGGSRDSESLSKRSRINFQSSNNDERDGKRKKYL